MLCPTCDSSNPDGNRFCGHCGAVLSAKYTPGRRSSDQLPKELVEFDRKIPLIAEPGTDRRNVVPENIREQMREVVERERNREAERQREAQREVESHRIAAVPPSNTEERVTLPSGFLGLNTPAEVIEEERAPVPVQVTEPPRATPRGANNNFWNLEELPAAPSSGGVYGPSFLGLSDSPEDVEQDEPESHTRRNVAFLVLLLLIGLGATQWHEIRDQALPFVKNGTQQVLLKVKGKQAQPPSDSSSATNANGSSSEPNIEVAPTNDNLKKAEPPANNATAANTPAATTPEPNTSAAASEAATDANSPATTGGVAGAATSPSGTSDTSKPTDSASPAAKAAGAKTSTTDETATAKSDNAADEDTTPPVKETAKKSSGASARERGRKPSAADRPQIEDEESQAGSAELAQANAATDPARQRQLLWQAVKKGNSDASVKLAELYIMGRGVEKSCDQAMVLLRSASAHSSSRARGKLGAMYATGECVEQDRVQAYHWMSMALQANPNSDWTARYRDSIWNQMTAAEKMRAGRDR